MERSEIRGRARERVGRSRITLRSIRATFLMRWEADERPEPRSLGLLPSGPDPVGEWLVHRQPPARLYRPGRPGKQVDPFISARASRSDAGEGDRAAKQCGGRGAGLNETLRRKRSVESGTP